MAKGNSPYSTGFASGKIDFDLNPKGQMFQYKTEEEAAKAPHTLPYEMGQLPQYFGEIVDNGFEAAKTLDSLLQTETYKNDPDLRKLKTNLEKILMYLMQNVDPILSKFTIGAKEGIDITEDDL
jgi:hypothetical protein